MDTTSALHHVRIGARHEHADIEIDGAQVAPGAVEAYTVTQVAGSPAHIVLHVTEQQDAQWSGVARVAVAEAAGPGPEAAVFLDAIDPELLERAALARPDLGAEPHAVTRAMLAQLGEWARGL
ncbi:hypothetical protein [Streptomyces catenulae]|uniref:Uncharacterized protein n=1 Tax=Streptomyces catenulae TaxID=66875 RepID=A0ABV2Z2I7_9ACTN|nr:hypothetical protein [Streptomyces catenulae]